MQHHPGQRRPITTLRDLADAMIDQSLRTLFLIPIDVTTKGSLAHPE
jgi:hypothetical protein